MSLIIGVAGLVLLLGGFYNLKKLRTIQNIPTSKIRSMAMGLVELKGAIAQEQEVLQSPITKKDCVHYQWKVEEQVETTDRNGKRRRTYWKTLRTGQKGRHFYLQDETGTVLVETVGANIDVDSVYREQAHGISSYSSNVREFLDTQRISTNKFFGTKKLRVTETILYPSQSLYIMGTAVDNPYVEDASTLHGHKDVMIRKGEEGYFYISDKQEKHIIRKFTLIVWGCFVVGGGAIVFALTQVL